MSTRARCGILFTLALLLVAVPNRFEGPTILLVDRDHGLDLTDGLALVALLAGAALPLGALRGRRDRPPASPDGRRRPPWGRA